MYCSLCYNTGRLPKIEEYIVINSIDDKRIRRRIITSDEYCNCPLGEEKKKQCTALTNVSSVAEAD